MSELGHWETRYTRPEYWFGTVPNAFLASQKPRLKRGWKALAVADGEGRNGVWLAEQGLDVTSVDFSPTALEKARKLAAERGVPLAVQQADLVSWSWPAETFDLVAAIFIQFVGPPERNVILAGIMRALKPGGLLLLQGYRPEQLTYGTGGPPDAVRCYTRAFLEETFGGLSSLDIREHDSAIAEGLGHNGLSALIDVVGVK